MGRYDRQALQLGEGQERLARSSVAIIGIGATGTHAASLLARAGVNSIKLIDRDIIEEANLTRQALFTEADVGMPKAVIAGKRLKEINFELEAEAITTDLTYHNIDIIQADLILDCTDNLDTRFLINEYAMKHKKKWIYSSAIAQKGYVKIFDGDCFACIFDESANPGTCEQIGVVNTIPSMIASLQANEAIKILAEKPYDLDLIYFDGKTNTLKKIKTTKNENCLVCAGRYDYLSGEKGTNPSKRCGGFWQITKKIDFDEIKKRLNCEDYYDFIKMDGITLFSDGRALIKADSEEGARKIYSKIIGD